MFYIIFLNTLLVIRAVKIILTIDIMTAVKNMISYAIGFGYDSPPACSGDLRLSINIPEMEGPMDIPIRNSNIVIPKEVPLKCMGAETNEILNAPISAKANPIAIIDSSIEITNGVGWYKNRTVKPNDETIPPKRVGFKLPILLTKNPERTEIIKDSIIKGN